MALTKHSISAPVPGVELRANLQVVGYWLSLGAAAGGLGGVLIGGVGGRLAMFILRLTSGSSVRGVESDDGFTIGRFSVGDSLQLLLVTTVLGTIVGVIVVAGRPFFPKHGMPFAWAFAGATTGGALLVHQDGVDFRLLEPHWFAVALFVAIPCLGAGLIAWLTEVYSRFWWRRRWLTALAAFTAAPSVVVIPIPIAALLVGGIWSCALCSPGVRSLPDWGPARGAAVLVFGIIVALGIFDLTWDAWAII